MQQALIEKDMPPREHLVDAAYISSALLVSSREEQDIGVDVQSVLKVTITTLFKINDL